MANLILIEAEGNSKERVEEFAEFILAEDEMMQLCMQKSRTAQQEIQSLEDAINARYQSKFPASFTYDID